MNPDLLRQLVDLAAADNPGTELYDTDIPRVDAVNGPATGIPFLIMKSATQPGAATMAPTTAPQTITTVTPSKPMPIAITDLIEQLTLAWTSWQAGLSTGTEPDQTDALVAKSRRAGGDEARWTHMLDRVGPVRSLQIRSLVAHESLTLARRMGIPAADAVKIAKGLCVSTEPKVRPSEGAALDALAVALRPGNAVRPGDARRR